MLTLRSAHAAKHVWCLPGLESELPDPPHNKTQGGDTLGKKCQETKYREVFKAVITLGYNAGFGGSLL
jgi:hypothetical protein